MTGLRDDLRELWRDVRLELSAAWWRLDRWANRKVNERFKKGSRRFYDDLQRRRGKR